VESAPVPENRKCPFCHPERILFENELACAIGEIAGQTVMHVHLHLIPRYKGDMPNPRGGVRGVIPSRQSY
jgi:diadenosine tetraphosphate (Ap4A) HIT family hydrolase